LFYASDYFEKLHDFAIKLIKDGKAYVDDQNAETIAGKKELQPAREPGKSIQKPHFRRKPRFVSSG
jgi:glutamyl/glutaminyl-tRNA synthetase